MPGICGACGIAFHNITDVVKCAGNCGLQYHSTCTNLRSQQDLTLLVKKNTQWMCNFCKTQDSNRAVENVNDSSQFNENLHQNIVDHERCVMDEFADLRSRANLLLKKVDKIEVAIGNIKAEYTDAVKMTERLRDYNKEVDDCAKNLTSKTFGLQGSERSYIVESSAPLSSDKNILNILESIGKSLKIQVYLLAALTLFFVTCKFYGQ